MASGHTDFKARNIRQVSTLQVVGALRHDDRRGATVRSPYLETTLFSETIPFGPNRLEQPAALRRRNYRAGDEQQEIL